MKPDGIAGSNSNSPVEAKGFHLKELGKKAAEMQKRKLFKTFFKKPVGIEKRQPRSFMSVIRRCFIKLRDTF